VFAAATVPLYHCTIGFLEFEDTAGSERRRTRRGGEDLAWSVVLRLFLLGFLALFFTGFHFILGFKLQWAFFPSTKELNKKRMGFFLPHWRKGSKRVKRGKNGV